MTAPQAFEALIRPHLDQLYRLAYRLTGAVADAEDLLQEVLIKLYRRRDELQDVGVLSPWLRRVLYNQFVDDRRRNARKRLVSLEDRRAEVEDVPATGRGPEAEAVHSFDRRRLTEALEQLSVEHRTVLLMHDAEGYKLEDIQEITGVVVGTLKSRLHRARGRLRALLKVHGTF